MLNFDTFIIAPIYLFPVLSEIWLSIIICIFLIYIVLSGTKLSSQSIQVKERIHLFIICLLISIWLTWNFFQISGQIEWTSIVYTSIKKLIYFFNSFYQFTLIEFFLYYQEQICISIGFLFLIIIISQFLSLFWKELLTNYNKKILSLKNSTSLNLLTGIIISLQISIFFNLLWLPIENIIEKDIINYYIFPLNRELLRVDLTSTLKFIFFFFFINFIISSIILINYILKSYLKKEKMKVDLYSRIYKILAFIHLFWFWICKVYVLNDNIVYLLGLFIGMSLCILIFRKLNKNIVIITIIVSICSFDYFLDANCLIIPLIYKIFNKILDKFNSILKSMHILILNLIRYSNDIIPSIYIYLNSLVHYRNIQRPYLTIADSQHKILLNKEFDEFKYRGEETSYEFSRYQKQLNKKPEDPDVDGGRWIIESSYLDVKSRECLSLLYFHQDYLNITKAKNNQGNYEQLIHDWINNYDIHTYLNNSQNITVNVGLRNLFGKENDLALEYYYDSLDNWHKLHDMVHTIKPLNSYDEFFNTPIKLDQVLRLKKALMPTNSWLFKHSDLNYMASNFSSHEIVLMSNILKNNKIFLEPIESQLIPHLDVLEIEDIKRQLERFDYLFWKINVMEELRVFKYFPFLINSDLASINNFLENWILISKHKNFYNAIDNLQELLKLEKKNVIADYDWGIVRDYIIFQDKVNHSNTFFTKWCWVEQNFRISGLAQQVNNIPADEFIVVRHPNKLWYIVQPKETFTEINNYYLRLLSDVNNINNNFNLVINSSIDKFLHFDNLNLIKWGNPNLFIKTGDNFNSFYYNKYSENKNLFLENLQLLNNKINAEIYMNEHHFITAENLLESLLF